MRFVLPLCLLLALNAAPKRPLTHADYDGWRNIQNQQISHDGKFLAYALFPEEGDGECIIRNLSTDQDLRNGIGARPPAPPVDFAANPDTPPPPRGITIRFTPDSRFVVFSTFPPKAEVDRAKRAKTKPEDMPKNGLVIVDLSNGAPVRIGNVKSFQLPEKANTWVAYQLEAPKGAKKDAGSGLVIRNLTTGADRTVPDVTEFAFAKDGQNLAYSTTSGTYSVAPGGAQAISLSPHKAAKLTWDRDSRQLGFVSANQLYLWSPNEKSARDLAIPSTPDSAPSDKGPVLFSRDGKRLFFGTAKPAPVEKEKPATVTPIEDNSAPSAEDKAGFDLWHWKDDYIQPMQKVRAKLEQTRTYRAVYNIPDRKFVQLADRTMTELTPSEDGRWAFGGDDREYRAKVEYDERYSDSYLVDTLTGSRKLLAKKHLGNVTWSPDGRYALLFNGKDWTTTSVPEGVTTNLTAKTGFNFATEDHDTPSTPGAYGLAGWTKDGKYVLVYDHYDIWQLAPDGSSAKNLTNGDGRKQRLMFRYVKLNEDPDDKWIDLSKPMLLRAESEDTHDSGFYRNGQRLLFGPKNYTAPIKARDAGVYVLAVGSFTEAPDLAVTDGTFRDLRKVTSSNPQQADVLWGTDEIVSFRNADGVPLKATLYKPENFDPSKKYPLLVYIYERLSQNVHNYIPPSPSNVINPTFYVSNGYLVLEPDIVYTVGYPGQSALKCVLPAVQEIVDRGYVNEKAIGIQGHSWGGYQIAYMITQTDRFRAVEAGAPVADMISAYNGIRWGPGIPRQFQYERTQSRIGGTPWSHTLRFIENSPVFQADRVHTPVLMMHNDADDAVPWYQGIEFFLSLRRLGKEAYLFDYNGEPHNLRRRANQKDFCRRMQEYFDYYLKGAPEPQWMIKGIPYLEREPGARENNPQIPAVTSN